MNSQNIKHIPVLSNQLAGQIALPSDGVMVDATTGQGGHSYLFGLSLGSNGTLIGFDVDQNAIDTAKIRLNDLKCKKLFINANFRNIKQKLAENGFDAADFILADLGFNSAQLSDQQKGLSFSDEMPLDMRLDKRISLTAADIINDYDEKDLADLIYKYGEDRASRRIARFIVQQRTNEPILTTKKLASVVAKAMYKPGKKWQRIHPATRTFQALRIAVNDELGALQDFLKDVPDLLKPNGKIAVISFHSLEDRIVKYDFKENKEKQVYSILTKKPLVADDEEIEKNRRARSAKLRIAQRL